MFTLTRTVRFTVSRATETPPATGANTYAASPPMRGLGAHYELDLACRANPHPVTGYLVSIADLDRAARTAALPIIQYAFTDHPETAPAALLPKLAEAANAALADHHATLHSLLWRLSPFYSVAMTANNPATVTLRQRFEFAAAHRLHTDKLSDEDNRAVYGKCNNPSGHGHNYVVEPAVELAPDSPFSLDDLERLTKAAVIDRFDHKNLTNDLDDFRDQVASVEHIARRCHELLAPHIERAGARLAAVTVWETEKTSCTYEPDPAQ